MITRKFLQNQNNIDPCLNNRIFKIINAYNCGGIDQMVEHSLSMQYALDKTVDTDSIAGVSNISELLICQDKCPN